jgi:hypothetical protein
VLLVGTHAVTALFPLATSFRDRFEHLLGILGPLTLESLLLLDGPCCRGERGSFVLRTPEGNEGDSGQQTHSNTAHLRLSARLAALDEAELESLSTRPDAASVTRLPLQ